MQCHKELTGRICTADAARKGHLMITLRHHTDGKLVYPGRSILFRHEAVEEYEQVGRSEHGLYQ